MARRAVATEDKQTRRQAILVAARDLFNAGDGTLPAAAEIAAAADLAKGTVYLYFRTKEEIFLALLLQGCIDALERIELVFRSTQGRRGDKVAAFIDAYVGHIVGYPELLRLDGICYGVLQKNISPARRDEFKVIFDQRMAGTAIVIEQALRLPAHSGVRLLTRSFALTRGLWQAGSAPETSPAEANEVAFGFLRLPFETELEQALAEYWRGALSS